MDIYYTLGSKPLHEKLIAKLGNDGSGMVAEGIFMLGKSSILTTGKGLRIGAFGGTDDPSTLAEKDEEDALHPKITATTLDKFAEYFETPTAASGGGGSLAAARAKAKQHSNTSLDILLTHTWPSNITLLSNKQLPSLPGLPMAHSWGNSAVTSALSYSTPKYIFSGGHNAFWEREPFIHPNGLSTRFVSLGQFGNTEKQRWFYAFTISPRTNGLKEDAPSGSTSSPLPTLTTAKKRGTGDKDENNSYIFAQQTSAYASVGGKGSKRGKKGHLQEITQDECWFCLSNPRVTKHLIVSIGEECYITLPKGQLPDAKDTAIPGGGHVLIIPISHYPNLFSLPAEIAQRVQSELLDCREALTKCYAKYDSVPVTFELGRYWSRGGHAHIQMVPVPKDLSPTLAQEFENEGVAQGVEWEADPQRALDDLEDGQSYLRVDLPDGKKFVHLIRPAPFNQQFARQVLANVLGIPDRADWRNCELPDDQETEIANDFRNAFNPFDKNVHYHGMNLRDDLEIVNAIYGDDTVVYNEKNSQVTLKTCINIDQDVVISNGEQSTMIRVYQLPPITAYLTVDGDSLTLTKFDSVASKTAISETLEELIKEPTAEEDEEGILMRIMNTLHTLSLQELLVEFPETLNDVVTKLMDHNMRYTREEFEQMSHDCQICLSRRKGLYCVQMECSCSIEAIRCPTSDCSQRISDSTIGAVVGEEILNRYVYLREKHAAEQVTACPTSTTHQFVRAYAQAAENSSEKLALERKYGRKYLQRLLNVIFTFVISTNRQEEDNEEEIVFVDRPDDDEGLEIQLALMQIAEEHM
ncbi:hypothetical protein E3Q01_01253 [Wallemia mellicola]|uniref:Cwf19-like C-terminal domain-containing protein n=1 Tax=Wallemia mellicola TaxID=1708541 RepID=A0A4T0TQS6_9BASI|nr:hypothetical protein E3Q01_01253 [Wallemia mellicola]